MLAAAARAAETDLVDAYVRDHLAGILAGEKAVKERKVSGEIDSNDALEAWTG